MAEAAVAKVLERACEHCGQPRKTGDRFCSRTCMAAAQTIEQAPCEVCSTPVAGPGRRFCSLECFSTSRWITARCAMCLEPFETYRSRPKRFCGGACHRTHQGLRQQGKRSHLWKGGKVDEARRIRSHSGYAAWRTKVFERDNYECQACFALGHDLTAHHIVAFADDPRKRLKVSNGVTLCRGCHRDFHRSNNRADILEAALVKRTDGFLKKEPGVWFTKIHGGGMSRAGLPDFFISVAGRMLTIELKVHPNFASPAQKHEIRRINAAGGIARICRSLDDVASAVDACKGAA